MADPLRFHPDVADDLEGAATWYDEISVELGNRFRAVVDSRLDAVELRPESFGMVDPPLRAARVERFPYLIVFEHSSVATEVLGIFHSASDPKKCADVNEVRIVLVLSKTVLVLVIEMGLT